MTFAEIVTFLLAGALLYWTLRPLRRRLEVMFRQWFGGIRKGSRSPVIDITDYSKKKEKDS